jgi:hypothetical protein
MVRWSQLNAAAVHMQQGARSPQHSATTAEMPQKDSYKLHIRFTHSVAATCSADSHLRAPAAYSPDLAYLCHRRKLSTKFEDIKESIQAECESSREDWGFLRAAGGRCLAVSMGALLGPAAAMAVQICSMKRCKCEYVCTEKVRGCNVNNPQCLLLDTPLGRIKACRGSVKHGEAFILQLIFTGRRISP